MRYTWSEAPFIVQNAVRNHVGTVTNSVDIRQGQNCNLATAVETSREDKVFVKGVAGVSRQMRWLRNEGEAGCLASGVAPSTLFQEDVDDDDTPWLVVGFEYVEGRKASLEPQSTDLRTVANTVDVISAIRAPELKPLRERWSSARYWSELAETAPEMVEGWDIEYATRWAEQAADAVEGDRLVHTDLHEQQFKITPAPTARVVDWGWPASAAGWVDAAFLVIRLIAAGHSPLEAEQWAESLDCWQSLKSERDLTAFAVYVAGLWSFRAATAPVPGSAKLATIARQYARHRIRY